MLESIGILAGIVSAIITGLEYKKTLSVERKEKVSQYLISIADTISLTVVGFKNKEIPHGTCDLMAQHAQEFPSMLHELFDNQQLYYYADMLQRAHHIEALYMIVQNDPNALTQLEHIANKFRVAAQMVLLK